MGRPKKDQYEEDPDDGLTRGIVGPWSVDKHQRLQRYVYASHGARKKFRSFGKQTSFIDLYCGPGKARIRDMNPEQVVDGSAVTAAKTAMTCTPYETYIVGDVNADLVAACEQRLRGAGATKVDALLGPVSTTVRTATSRLQKTGLHFAFLDPFNADLPFDVIQELGELPKMDQLIHFSIMDFKRNLNSMKEDGRLDALAPGWSSAVKPDMGIDQQRISIFRYWRGLLESKLKYKVSNKIVKVRGPNRAEIYWLIFASRHDLGGRLWKEIADLSPQPQRELQL